MNIKFAIEYDMYHGLFDGVECGQIGVYDSLDEVEAAFTSAIEKVHSYYGKLPYDKRQHTSYLVATYCRRVDEDGKLTDEEVWDELTEDDKERLNSLSHSFEP